MCKKTLGTAGNRESGNLIVVLRVHSVALQTRIVIFSAFQFVVICGDFVILCGHFWSCGYAVVTRVATAMLVTGVVMGMVVAEVTHGGEIGF